ncbi:Alpha-L-rhamnosidase [Penicillium ucsense]|uniref:Alpha-L-rhamnosidase n=1 Tax=Penicillium ucsense TaxID=2839758 RepID=A0A8J8VWU7_9EURO|nr:Alpha-L-rhamnosidase [Penicillium ucsense]KAF7731326.1 Alpha-L-rhamnosidase [Penicillium ucsense]
MAVERVDTSWMWHPSFSEECTDTAGLFVHFRRTLKLDSVPLSCKIQISADTRYKLYVNKRLASFGPVKGDQSLWFYDEIDISPYLGLGENQISIRVLRFFYATQFATSFPRLPSGGVYIVHVDSTVPEELNIKSSTLWETAIDYSTKLRINEAEDDFLHIYEQTDRATAVPLKWIPAALLSFQNSTGLSAPWKLSPRLIPYMERRRSQFSAIHNLRSCVPHDVWHATLVQKSDRPNVPSELHLPPGSKHQLDLEASCHMTAFLQLRFLRPGMGGSRVTLTYAESYENTPIFIPYLRSKGQRCDTSKPLFGPQDRYTLGPGNHLPGLEYDDQEDEDEVIAPFHFRTFRFIRLSIEVGSSELLWKGINLETVNYPLNIVASLRVDGKESATAKGLWETSVRTLKNCMHDCYEDCPFYEQLQYAMDTRSSALFTYYVSGDDRLARQAIIQLHNSFQPHIGLTASRAPSHQLQIIPHFSLYWICMLVDHWTFFADRAFLRPFLPVVDAILAYFDGRIDPSTGLVILAEETAVWNFHDWADDWRPYGIPPAVVQTGISSYSNNVYAYTLKKAATLQLGCAGRASISDEYLARADRIVDAIRSLCFDGEFFTDTLVASCDKVHHRSQHNQVWAVLSGAINGQAAQTLLLRALGSAENRSLTPTSISMSFYTLRALSAVGGGVYDELFHQFWKPWNAQIALGLTTWEEDSVSQRSDCHAWGSAPIYEFMAEVTGLRPGEPGWASLIFEPKLGLYREIKASVPFRNEGHAALASVTWTTNASSEITVSLNVSNMSLQIPVHVRLPSQAEMLMNTADDLTWTVKMA